jgi:phosphopantetheine binding protein
MNSGSDKTAVLIDAHPEVIESFYRAVGAGFPALAIVRSTGFLTAPELRRYCGEQGGSCDFDVLLLEKDDACPGTLESLADSPYPDGVSRFASAAGPLEGELVALWERVLDFVPVGVLDDFVDLGGDSLGAVEIAAVISRRWGADLALIDLVDASTIRNLARILESRPNVKP